ncbi:MAG TPA: hypothetical protein PLQ20_02945 [Candidatus Paceibacterota bacterium]|nr:hypothetical protein [Candidatus Paceibacterota bacterium]
MDNDRKRQSHQKVLNYLDEFIDSDYFQNEVIRLRKKLGIPSQGLEISKELEENLNKPYPVYNFFQLPKELSEKSYLKDLNLAMKNIGKKIKIYDLDINYFLRAYILYNKKILNIINDLTDADLAQVQDFYELLYDYPSEFTVDKIRNLFEYYPIVIKIHPSMTQRDLVDYVRNRWEYIEYLLGKHKNKDSKLGKVKRKKTTIRERNAYIWENRNLPRKRIMGLLYDKYGPDTNIDYAYIGKIISLEKKRRKEL